MRHARRMRRGLGGTAVAAVAMAALTASQAPGLVAHRSAAPKGDSATGPSTAHVEGPTDDSYHTEIPPLVTPAAPKTAITLGGSGPAWDNQGIPATVLAAYRKAESDLARSDKSCRLPWQLLAAIGKVESGQARGGAVDAQGTTLSPILGPVLNGSGFAHIADTDGGAYDGDARYDRAVGPMQFIPSTWASWGQDGNGDGKKDPNNIFDAALAAGRYLCAGSRDLAVKADLDRSILSYNHSDAYLALVLSWLSFYREGVHQVPDGQGVLPQSPGAGSAHGDPKPPAGDKPGGGGIVIGPQPSGKPSGTAKPSHSPSPGASPSPTGSDSASPDPGPSDGDTGSPSPTASESPSPDPSDSASTPPACPSPSDTASPSPDPSATPGGDGCTPLPSGEGGTPAATEGAATAP
ncbi:lytic murein transglycosylase [Streptomyces sp. NPDC050738]|uniref:lytic murein transglycosylase n=1 Tax=Streptomyces sp. NPDC050738 TaxID=3154744 RepID=UPI00343B003D